MKGLLGTGEVTEVFHKDKDGKAYISQHQDIEPYLKKAHHERSIRGEHSRYQSEVFNKKASIPETVALKWCRDKGVTYQEFLSNPKVLKNFLNDPDNKMFLLIPGKV